VLVFLGRIYEIAFRIAIMMTDPGHGEGKCRRQVDLFRVFESARSVHLGVLRSEFFLVVGLWCFSGDFGKNGSQNVVFLW
jgi:hypothetical protein